MFMNCKFTFLIFTLLIITSCNSGTSTLDSTNSNSEETIKSPEELKRDLKDIEFESPTEYLKTSGTYHPTFLGNKIKVDLKIENNATIASFKDVVIHFTYYSKTKTEIRSFDHTIYEIFKPGTTKDLEIKIDNYDEVETINWDISQASPYQ